KYDVKRVAIDPSLFDDDRDMIEDLVAAAFNDAQRKAEATAQEKMSAVTAGLSLPAGMKLPYLDGRRAARTGTPARPDRCLETVARGGGAHGPAHGLSPAAA